MRRQACGLEDALEGVLDRTRAQRPPRGVAEHPGRQSGPAAPERLRLAFELEPPRGPHEPLAHVDCPPTAALRGVDPPTAAKRPSDANLPLGKVQILPLEGKRLAKPQPGPREEKEEWERARHGLGRGSNKPRELLTGHRLDLVLAGARDAIQAELAGDPVGRVGQNHAVLDRRVQHPAEDREHELDRGAGKADADLLGEELLDPPLGDLTDLRFAEHRQQVEAQIAAVHRERARLHADGEEAEPALGVGRDGDVRIDDRAGSLARLPALRVPNVLSLPPRLARHPPADAGRIPIVYNPLPTPFANTRHALWPLPPTCRSPLCLR